MSAFKPLNFWSQNKKCLEHYTVFRVFFLLWGGGGVDYGGMYDVKMVIGRLKMRYTQPLVVPFTKSGVA